MPAPAATASTEFSVFLPFGKVDKQPDGTLMVHTVLNDETIDDQGEIVDYGAIEKASADYLQWANVREMHGDETAAGTMVALTPDPVARTHEAVLHVVDPVAVQKVLTKVYKGSSLGGFKRRIRLQKAAGGETIRRVTEIDWRETSLVDRPSRPTAVLTLLKRSEGDDPPPLIEEEDAPDEAVAELAKVSEAPTPAPEPAPEAPVPAPAAPAVIAPEAGIDTYLGAGGLPLAKAAADDLCTADMAIEMVARLITQEAAEGDEAQIAPLRAALASLQQFAGLEAAELGTPEDVAAAADEDVAVTTTVIVTATDEPMIMASKGGDLGKGEPLGREAIAAIVEEVLAKRAAPAIEPPPAVPEPAPTEPEAPDAGELLRKTTTYIDEQFARFVSRPDLDAMKAEVLGALTPMSEAIAKIAKAPAPGGPLRYAVDGDRFADESRGPATEAEVLHKASLATGDPHVREELGRLAAAAEIAADRKAAT